MGKKSNAKKEIREILSTNGESEKIKKKLIKKTKSKAELKSKIIEKKQKKEKFKAKKLLLILFILVLSLLSFSIFFLYLFLKSTFKAEDFAKYLPYEKTVFFMELNTDLNHLQNLKTFKIIENEKGISLDSIIEQIENKYGFSYKNEVSTWLKRKIGLALIKINEHTERLIYFCEVSDKEKANEFFNIARPEEIYKDTEIYKSNNKFFLNEVYLININSYYILAEDIDALKTIVDTSSESFRLNDSEKYKKIVSNLPLQKIAFAFIDYTKVNTVNLSFISDSLTYLTTETLVNVLDQNHSEGIAVIAEEDKFLIKTFVNYLNNSEDQSSIKLKYKGDLLKYAPKDSILFFGGVSLNNNMDSVKSIILKEIFSTLFTTRIELSADILPLFESEYLILLNKELETNKIAFSLILDVQDIKEEKLNKVIQNFIEKNAGFDRKNVKRELEDGSSYYEVIAVNKDIPLKNIEYNGIDIKYYQLEEKDFSVFFTIKDNKLYLSFSLEILKQLLETTEDMSILNTDYYKSYISEIQKYSDEITYLNFSNLSENLENVKLNKFFDIFDIYTYGKTRFNDGLVTINLLKIK